MRSPALSRPVLLFTFALLTAAPAAARLDMPVWTPGSDVTAPFYRGDVLELELRPDAARRALPRGAGPSGARRVGRLGVAAVDAVAAAVGAVGFEPEFRGETPPAPGDDAPDLTAFHLVHLGPGADLESALEAFRALPEVAGADPIAVLPVSQLPNDSLAFATWWLHRTPPPRTDIRAPEAWQVMPGDTSIVVAVLDTGIIPWHPDLGGNGIERGQLWANWIERAGVAGVDDDLNGFIDDVAGWDFVVDGAGSAAGEDRFNEDNDPNDWGGHGTAVAGVLGAIPGNGIGLAGVVPNVRIMSLRMGWYVGGVPPTGVVDMSYAARAIQYATRMGAHVLNCSWQSQNTGGLAAAVTAATRAGVVVVNAAGNGTLNTYLGQRDDVISVAATDTADVVWEFSNKDPWIDLSAPGVNIVSTMFDFPRGGTTDSIAGRKPGYRTASGTSFSAPMVAGVAALAQAQRRSLGLDPLTPAGMLHRLRETTDDIRAVQFPGITGFGTGRLNAFRALTEPWHSLAVRARARTIGPPVVIPDNTGRSLVVYAMSDRSLVAYDGASGDTAWVRPLPALPTGQLAAAEFPQPLGVLIAAGTTAGTVHLVHDDGRPLPGWPVTLQAGINLSSGVAFGDVTGDGVPEVVAGGTAVSGSGVWAIQVPSTEIPAGFPFDPGVAGLSLPALADLDGAPGEEIAFMDGFGALRVVKGDGSELAGFPSATATAPRSPVIARLGPPGTPPSIVVASSNQLTAYAPDGGTRWSVPLGGSPVQDPALGDLDGDGVDEIVLANATPQTIDVRTAAGAAFTARPGWPVTVPSPALGPPLVGPIATDGGPSIVFFRTAGLTALDDSANVIPTFPKPGLAGQSPSLAELDGDGATEIAAGAALADSNVHTYDAGPATWSPALAHWPTPRGDIRRSASHATGTPGPFVADRVRPAMVTALTAQALSTTAVEVRWVTTGDDSLAGAATRAILRRAPFPLDDSNWPQGIPVPTPEPRAPGGTDTVRVEPLPEGSTWWFAVRMVDDVGHMGAVSPSDSAALPGLAPAAITDLRALAVTETTVVLTWSATGEDGDQGRPRAYQVSGSTQPLDAGNVDAAPLQVRRPAFHDAGIGETTLVVPLTPGRRWQFGVRGIDRTEALGPISNVVEIFTPVGGAIRGRIGIALAPRPHPAVADVVIDWQGDGAPAGPHWLLVYDLSGRERRRIALGSEPGGSYTWDGRDGDSRLLPAGLYFLRLVSGARHADSRVVFIR